jgi:hypothetical protein
MTDLFDTFRQHERGTAAVRLLRRIRETDPDLWQRIQEFAKSPHERHRIADTLHQIIQLDRTTKEAAEQ